MLLSGHPDQALGTAPTPLLVDTARLPSLRVRDRAEGYGRIAWHTAIFAFICQPGPAQSLHVRCHMSLMLLSAVL